MRIIFFIIFFLSFDLAADELLKPSYLLKPDQVIAIQLTALKNNDNPYQNYGIEQTWEFAHPKNRIFTGPLKKFIRMMNTASYSVILNHRKHSINTILVNDNIALFYVEIVDSNGINLAFEWVVEKVLTEGIYKNCWMTVSVSTPIKFGNSA